MNRPSDGRIVQRIISLVAVLFGLVTLFAGARVLSGSDPGYLVFQPLLTYNTVMGIAYVAAGVIAWGSVARGAYAAATIFILNLIVLAAVGYLYATGSAIAVESIRAMTFRTVVWLLLCSGLIWLRRRNAQPG